MDFTTIAEAEPAMPPVREAPAGSPEQHFEKIKRDLRQQISAYRKTHLHDAPAVEWAEHVLQDMTTLRDNVRRNVTPAPSTRLQHGEVWEIDRSTLTAKKQIFLRIHGPATLWGSMMRSLIFEKEEPRLPQIESALKAPEKSTETQPGTSERAATKAATTEEKGQAVPKTASRDTKAKPVPKQSSAPHMRTEEAEVSD